MAQAEAGYHPTQVRNPWLHLRADQGGSGLMSDVRDHETDSQEAPVVNTYPYIQDLVIADMEARKQFGISKYGTALQPFNGRNMLQDAYEELLDLLVYIKGQLIENQITESEWEQGRLF